MVTTDERRVGADAASWSGPVPQGLGRRSVLVIATTDTLLRSVSRILARVPFDVYTAETADAGLAAAAEHQVNLIVIECEITQSISEYLVALREARRAPIMLVGADATQGAMSLESGMVVDYVRTPLWEGALRARAERHAAPDPGLMTFGDLTIDCQARSVSIAGRPVAVTPREYDLMEFLASHPGTVFSLRQLLERVWGSSPMWQQLGTVREHVYRLRTKLKVDPTVPEYIVTVPSVGYYFEGHLEPAIDDRSAV